MQKARFWSPSLSVVLQNHGRRVMVYTHGDWKQTVDSATNFYFYARHWPTELLLRGYRAVFNWVSEVISELLWFCITSLSDWFKVLAPFFQPIRSETKTNRGLRVHIFPRFVSATLATCNYFEF